MLRSRCSCTHSPNPPLCVSRHTIGRSLGGLVIIAVFLLACGIAVAGGGPPGTELEARISKSDDTVGIAIRVTSAPSVACDGSAHLGRQSITLPPLITGPGGVGQWSWILAPHVPAGHWRVAATCSRPEPQHATVSFLASGTGRFETRSDRLHLGPVHAGTLAEYAAGGNGGAESLYPYGQCTWYVAKKRPDLPYAGNATNWLASARDNGIETGTVPVPGAVAVFQPGQYGAGRYGHVAYVEAVDPVSKTMTISEYNFTHHLRWDERANIPWLGVHFIYGGPAVTNPGEESGHTAAPPVNIVPPQVTGSPSIAGELTCAPGTWSGATPVTYSYKWLRGGTIIVGKGGNYVLTEGDAGYPISCEVTATNPAGAANAQSQAIRIASTPPQTVPFNVSPPSVAGTPAPEQTLTCLTGTWESHSPITYAYAWFTDGVRELGAVEPTYLVTSEDEGKSLSCEVLVTNSYGTGTATSIPVVVQ